MSMEQLDVKNLALMEQLDPCCDFPIKKSILDLLIGEIAIKVEPISKTTKTIEAFLRFTEDEKLSLIPVVEGKVVIGQLHRIRFLEHIILGRYGYGIHLNSRKYIWEVMEKPSLIVDYNISVEEASMIIQKRNLTNIYDDIIVSNKGEYYGIVPVHLLLEAITQRAIMIAKDSNPLTGLPGNWAIQREITKRINAKCPFEACYIDINHFKPYNDHYGFEKGDKVISHLGDILKEIREIFPEIFIGHIGGDDFIIICPPGLSELICESIINAFEELLPSFHGEDFIKGYYISKNRKGEEEVFSLLSLTCAVVSTEDRHFDSFAQLASVASEVKAEAKKLSRLHKKSVIFKDRRKG